MKSLPVNVINLICEWAAKDDTDWYPFFCQKTHKLSWKVNKYSKNLIEKGNIVMHNPIFTKPIIEGTITLSNTSTFDTYITKCTLTFLKIFSVRNNIYYELYVQFDSENDVNKKDKFIYRSKINFRQIENYWEFIYENEYYLYLNSSPYALIRDCYIDTIDFRMNMIIELF
jgi:hypothetical protein